MFLGFKFIVIPHTFFAQAQAFKSFSDCITWDRFPYRPFSLKSKSLQLSQKSVLLIVLIWFNPSISTIFFNIALPTLLTILCVLCYLLNVKIKRNFHGIQHISMISQTIWYWNINMLVLIGHIWSVYFGCMVSHTLESKLCTMF